MGQKTDILHTDNLLSGILGKEISIVLPACRVPPPGDEEQFTFEGYHFPDE